ncbi:hypothetical protein SAMN05216225_105220, partial [Ornithinibacillus halophilus]
MASPLSNRTCLIKAYGLPICYNDYQVDAFQAF